MRVIGLKGFLTDEHHSWAVVAAGGVVGGGQGVVAVVVTWLVTGKINFNLLNCRTSLRESYVVPVSGVPLGLNVASLHWNLLFSGSEV